MKCIICNKKSEYVYAGFSLCVYHFDFLSKRLKYSSYGVLIEHIKEMSEAK